MADTIGWSSPSQILKQALDTYDKKGAEYGGNFYLFPQVMTALFPDGLELKSYEDWLRAQFVMLKVVKLTRYSQHFKNGGHKDSIHDDLVYSAILESVDEEMSNINANGGTASTNEDRR